MKPNSIKFVLFRYFLMLVISVFLVTGVSVYVIEEHRAELLLQEVAAKLAAKSESTADLLIGPLLLKEERPAVDKILNKIKLEEGLALARIITPEEALAFKENQCKAITNRVAQCIDSKHMLVKTFTDILTVDSTVAVLEKVQLVSTSSNELVDRGPLYLMVVLFLSLSIFWALKVFRFIDDDIRVPLSDLDKFLVHRRIDNRRVKNNIFEVEEIVTKLENLFETYKKQEVTAALGDLAAKIVHDLRGPLSLLNVLTERKEAVYTQEETRLIRMAVLKVEGLASSLLDQYKNDKATLMTAAWADLIKDLADEHAIKGQKHNYKVVINIDKAAIVARPVGQLDLWYRHLNNLIENAVKAGAKDIEVRVQLKNPEQMCIAVIDNGKGMSLEEVQVVKVVGESFTGGNGLGLSQLREFITVMGGELQIRSQLGQGTEVELTIKAI